jgi:alpha-beta hydrolase superfamily lysophospholipase
MNTNGAAVANLPSGAPNAPMYFPSTAPRLFGWLHRPAGVAHADLGLVICKPFGYEALCAHRALRAFAASAAAAGVPTLSFDYAGTGDSFDTPADADQLELWCEDIVTAVAELRQQVGVRRVCLLGFRLGALLASMAAIRSPVDALILVAPIVSGRAHLRELRRMQLVAALRGGPEKHAGPGSKAAPGDGSMEVGGYRLSAPSIAHLERLDLATLGPPPVSALLVIDRTGLAEARAWTQSLDRAAVRAQYLTQGGFVEMMMTPPQYTRVPQEMITQVCQWLLGLTSAAEHAAAPRQTIGGVEQARGARFSERPVRFGLDAGLFGIVTEPHGTDMPRRAVVLVNAGADSHVCVGRLYVALARRWAEAGYVVLRMDLAGLGDSTARPAAPDNEVYPAGALEDVREAVALLRARYRTDDVVLAGLCSGAYHALQAAAEGMPLTQVLVVNPQTFFWHEGTSIDQVLRMSAIVTAHTAYGEKMRSPEYWKKLLSGQTENWYIAGLCARRLLLLLTTRVRHAARWLHLRVRDDLGAKLAGIAERGVQITLVFAQNDPGLELLRLQAGAALQSLGERCRVHVIEGADHTFTRSSSRRALEEVLSEALYERYTTAGAARSCGHSSLVASA